MKIIFLPQDMDAPAHYRCLFPARQLRDHGVDVRLPEYEDKEVEREDGTIRHQAHFKLGDLPPSADLWVFQQPRWRDVNYELIKRLRGLGCATAIDVDDNYINIPSYSPAFRGTHPYARKDGSIVNRRERRAYFKNAGTKQTTNRANYQHMLGAMNQVDLVTVSTPFLAEVYSPYHKDIRVIRNCIDWDIFSDITPQYEVERERLRIGWFGVFDFRSADLKVIQRPLQRFLHDHPEVDFVTNKEETHNFLGVPEGQRVTIGEYEFFDRETGLYRVGEMTAQCDIGLVPLAMNDLNRGKSHLKGMEYNACGIPFIASPTESYCWWSGTNGGLAHNEDEWYGWMETLINDHEMRRKMGVEARMKARAQSVQNRWRDWDDVYSELVGDEITARARKAIQMGAVQKVSELDPLLRLVADKRPKTIVEIGTARGGTFWAIAQTAPDDALLISIDVPSGSPLDMRDGKDVYTGRDRDRIKLFKKERQQLKLIDLDSQRSETLAVLQHALEGRKIDLLFIDGDHRYEGVAHDYDTYGPLVAPGGLIAFHDIVQHEDKRVGVKRLWDEICETKEEFIGPETWGFKPWGGIGVVYA